MKEDTVDREPGWLPPALSCSVAQFPFRASTGGSRNLPSSYGVKQKATFVGNTWIDLLQKRSGNQRRSVNMQCACVGEPREEAGEGTDGLAAS